MNRRPLFFWIALIVVGFAARLVLSWFSFGSTDFATWERFGHLINDQGLVAAYAADPLLNHPPIPALWSAAAVSIAERWGLLFSFVFRLPAILADGGSAMLLYSIWKRGGATDGLRAAAAMACSVAALLISAYHCNTDNICVFFALLAAYWLTCTRRPLLAGLALAAAINIKVIPLLLVPLLATCCVDRRALVRFIVGIVTGLLPIAVGAAVAGMPMVHNVFAYRSMVGQWGVMYLLMELKTNRDWFFMGEAGIAWYLQWGRFVLLGVIALLTLANWRWQRWNALQAAALGMAVFLVLAPGFGVQYLVYAAPLVLAVDLRRGVAYSTVAGLFLLIVYRGYWTGTIPLRSEFGVGLPPPAALLGFAAWGVLVAFVFNTIWWPGNQRSGENVNERHHP